MSNCCGCGKSNGFEDGGWINVCPAAILQFANEGLEVPIVAEQNWLICETCTRYAVAAWAREDRRKRQEKNPPPSPTNSPAGSGTGFVELLQAVA
jgi:hypothetical protein